MAVLVVAEEIRIGGGLVGAMQHHPLHRGQRFSLTLAIAGVAGDHGAYDHAQSEFISTMLDALSAVSIVSFTVMSMSVFFSADLLFTQSLACRRCV